MEFRTTNDSMTLLGIPQYAPGAAAVLVAGLAGGGAAVASLGSVGPRIVSGGEG